MNHRSEDAHSLRSTHSPGTGIPANQVQHKPVHIVLMPPPQNMAADVHNTLPGSSIKDEPQPQTRRPSRQYIPNRKFSSAKPPLKRNKSLEVLTAQRQLMDKALRELYTSMQELRQPNDAYTRSRQLMERTRSLDDSDIPEFPAPLKMSTLTPMERVAIKGLASQRRRSLRSKSVTDKKSVYHSLIPEVFLDDDGVYRRDSLGVNPWIDQSSRSTQVDGDTDMNEQSLDKSSKERILRREHIYESLENILNEIETFSDYKVPSVHLKISLQEDQMARPSPRMTMEVPSSAMQSLFETPKPKHQHRARITSEKSKPVSEVCWEPEIEYRSVLTGQRLPPVTPSYNIFYGQSVSTTSKVLRTLSLAYAYFILGMCVSMIGPALLDISEIAHIPVQDAYQFLTIRGAGVAVGCVLLGSMIRRFDHYMIFAMVLAVCGIANLVFPALDSYVGMVLVEMLIGVCLGFLEAGVQIVCIEIWQEENGLYMLAIHFVYGLGTIIGPLIAQPFLSDHITSAVNDTGLLLNTETPVALLNTTSLYDHLSAVTPAWPEPYFQYAYFIVGGLFLSCAMCQVFIWFWSGECSCRYKSGQMDDISSLYTNIANKQPALLILTAVFMFIHVGIEFSYRGLLASYVVQSLGWTRSYGAWITSVTFSTYTLGRGLGFGFSRCLDSGVLLWFNLALVLVALLVELLLVEHHPYTIWVTTSIQGLGQSTVMPSCFLWASNKLQVQGITAGILLFLAALGLMVLPGVTGLLMSSFKLAAFQVVPLAGVVLNVAIFLAMYILGRRTEDLLSIVGISGSCKTTDMSSTPKTRITFDEAGSFDQNANNQISDSSQEQILAAGPSSLRNPKLTSFQIHPEFTGSPRSYKVHNEKFTPQSLPKIQVTAATTGRTRRSVSPCSAIQSPYSMNSFTPLAVLSSLHPNSAR